MAWQETVAQTVTGLGYDLVDLERSAGGLLRVTIDWPWQPPTEGQLASEERHVTVEDCEKVTRQLHYLLEVEGLEYRRLEVGSPGIDRPLRNEVDFVRFEGQVIGPYPESPDRCHRFHGVSEPEKISRHAGACGRWCSVAGGLER